MPLNLGLKLEIRENMKRCLASTGIVGIVVAFNGPDAEYIPVSIGPVGVLTHC
jgi:hypothetical protein